MREIFYNAIAAAIPTIGMKRLPAARARLGALLWHILPKRRRLAIENISARLHLSEKQAEVLARKAFTHNAGSFLEMLFLNQFDWRFLHDYLHIERPDLFTAFINDERPGIAATAHLGAWEFLGCLLSMTHYPRPERIVVVRRNKDKALNRLIFRLRSRPGVTILPHRQAVFPVLRALRKGGLTAFLVDHNCPASEAVFLPFLDELAAVNVGPAMLAVRAKAKVWPIFLVRGPEKGHYTLYQDPPLDTVELNGDREQNIRATAEFYTNAVAKYVRRFPEQWFWMHNRWKTKLTD